MLSTEEQQKLIAETINSAVCIDNEYVGAYADCDDDTKLEKSRQMYESFRDSGKCYLDIYTFTGMDAYHRDKEKILRNRDLVILDWELDDNKQCKYEDALAILDDVCQNEQIHFVDIYTQADNYSEIAHAVYSYFKLQKRDELLPHVNEIVELLSDMIDGFGLDGFDSDSAKELIEGQLGSFIMNPERRDDIVKQVKKDVFRAIANAGGNGDINKALCDELRACFEKDDLIKSQYDLYRAYCICYLCDLGYVSQSGMMAKAVNPTTVLVNGTVVHVTSKGSINGEGLFSDLISAIVGIPKHRSLLLSLLLKKVVNQNLASVGKELGSISEASLLAHCGALRKEEAAEENVANFIVSVLAEHICSVFQNGEHVSMLNSLIDDGQTVSLEMPLKEEHVKLNSLLTFLPKEKMVTDIHQIKTGDVFVLDKAISDTDKADEHAYSFLLCITQSCDALRPSKVNNNLAFVLGEKAQNMDAVEKAEKDFHTFLPDKSIVIWTKKFFTIFIKDTKLSLAEGEGKVTFHYIDGDFTATFLGTQKEAYTYRIINNVFSNAMRIGVDLPHSK